MCANAYAFITGSWYVLWAASSSLQCAVSLAGVKRMILLGRRNLQNPRGCLCVGFAWQPCPRCCTVPKGCKVPCDITLLLA